MTQKSEISIRLWIGEEVRNIISGTFAYMLENYNKAGVIDHAAWLIDSDELKRMTALVEPRFPEAKAIELEVSTRLYEDFMRLIDYAGFAALDLDHRKLLETIYDERIDPENVRHSTYALLSFTPSELTAHISIFKIMIDDPEAIDNSMYDLTSWENFLALVAKLENLDKEVTKNAVAPMTFTDWATFRAYASHVDDLDQDDLNEKDRMNMLHILGRDHTVFLQSIRYQDQ